MNEDLREHRAEKDRQYWDCFTASRTVYKRSDVICYAVRTDLTSFVEMLTDNVDVGRDFDDLIDDYAADHDAEIQEFVDGL